MAGYSWSWRGDWPIPKKINLPGMPVKVKQVEGLAGALGFFSYNSDKERAVIHVEANLSLPCQRYIILHELQHAITELLDVQVAFYPDHVQPWHPPFPLTYGEHY